MTEQRIDKDLAREDVTPEQAVENADAVLAACRYELDVNLDHSDSHRQVDMAADVVEALIRTYRLTGFNRDDTDVDNDPHDDNGNRQDWLDDAANFADADEVVVRLASDAMTTDLKLTGAQVATMFRALAASEANDDNDPHDDNGNRLTPA